MTLKAYHQIQEKQPVRPWITKPIAELRAVVKSLNYLLEGVEREINLRRKQSPNKLNNSKNGRR